MYIGKICLLVLPITNIENGCQQEKKVELLSWQGFFSSR